MEVTDGKGRTEYSKHKAGKDLRNSSLVSLFHPWGKRNSREEHRRHV